jgi:hypothetical protein
MAVCVETRLETSILETLVSVLTNLLTSILLTKKKASALTKALTIAALTNREVRTSNMVFLAYQLRTAFLRTRMK